MQRSKICLCLTGKTIQEETKPTVEPTIEEPEEKGTMGWVIPTVGIGALILALILVLTKKKLN